MTEEERISTTNGLLTRMPFYGEFEIVYKALVSPITHTTAENMIRNVAEHADERRRINMEQEIVQELIFGGFIITRHDIKVDGKTYMQLTERGRELKELGSMKEYSLVQETKAANLRAAVAQRAREDQRNEYLFWITLSIAIATGLSAAYYVLEILRIQYHLGLPYHVFFQ